MAQKTKSFCLFPGRILGAAWLFWYYLTFSQNVLTLATFYGYQRHLVRENIQGMQLSTVKLQVLACLVLIG